jgi:hypothetical protein
VMTANVMKTSLISDRVFSLSLISSSLSFETCSRDVVKLTNFYDSRVRLSSTMLSVFNLKESISLLKSDEEEEDDSSMSRDVRSIFDRLLDKFIARLSDEDTMRVAEKENTTVEDEDEVVSGVDRCR